MLTCRLRDFFPREPSFNYLTSLLIDSGFEDELVVAMGQAVQQDEEGQDIYFETFRRLCFLLSHHRQGS